VDLPRIDRSNGSLGRAIHLVMCLMRLAGEGCGLLE
jgi:hypothetical protein